MKKQRTHLAATKIRWIVVLLVACFGQDAVALPAGPDRMGRSVLLSGSHRYVRQKGGLGIEQGRTIHAHLHVTEGVELIESDGGLKEMLRIHLTLPGILAPFWKSDYWFALPEGVFFRFKGPSGPPGSPMIIVTRTAC
jgi:hypothetical protein